MEIYDFQDYNEEKGSNEDKDINKKDNMILYVIIIIILSVAITGVAAYFIGKYLNKIRRKRANELVDDEYEYSPETKYSINF